jgi:phosphoglycolate phosphatase
MSKRKYKAVIFDFDDTLVESRVQKWAQHKAVAKKFYNMDITDDDIIPHWGKAVHTLISEIYKNADSLENIYGALSSTRREFPKKIYEGSLDIVNKLLKDSVKVGIVSAASKEFILQNLNDFNFPISRLFIIQGADDTDFHKPHPDVFLPAIKKLSKEGIEKNQIVYVGDSLLDLQAAHAAGIDFVGVTTGLYSKDDFEKHGAKIVVENIKEVLNSV